MSRIFSSLMPLLVFSMLLVPGVALAADGASMSSVLVGIGLGWAISAAALVKDPRLGALLAGLMGLGISLYLGAQHAQTGDLACTIDATFDCGSVVRSEYSTLLGIPVAFLGSAFYAAASMGGLMALLKPGEYERGGRLLTWGGIIAMLFSGYLAWASMQLGKWCLFCISMYGINALLLAAGMLWDRSAEPGESDSALWGMSTAGAVVFAATMVFYGQVSTGGSDDPVVTPGASSAALSTLFEATTGKMTLDGTEPIYGNPSAPYTVVEFADFECPYCGKVAPELKNLVDKNSDIRLLFKHYPLSPICNSSVQRDMHPDACNAAQAAECARQQERFWELTTLMFKNQSYLSSEDLLFLTAQVGMDEAAYTTCMSNPMTETAVLSDISHANSLNIHGTPALFLLGVTGEEWVHIKGSPEEIGVLVAAHRDGQEIPPTPPAEDHGH